MYLAHVRGNMFVLFVGGREGGAAVVLHLTNWGYKSQGEVKRCAKTAVTLCKKEKWAGGEVHKMS